MVEAVYYIGFNRIKIINRKKAKVMKYEINKKIKGLLFYETERKYKGACIDEGQVYGDCGAGGPARIDRKRKKQDGWTTMEENHQENEGIYHP